MKIIKGSQYKGLTGIIVKATEDSNRTHFTGIVVRGSEDWGYKVGYESDGWASCNFELYKTAEQIDKENIRQDLINSINAIFANESDKLSVKDCLLETRNYINEHIRSKF